MASVESSNPFLRALFTASTPSYFVHATSMSATDTNNDMSVKHTNNDISVTDTNNDISVTNK